MKRRNKINDQWSPRLVEMLRSPAYRALSLSEHRVLSRVEIELADHGGNDNGRLPVTKQDFIDYGVSGRLVASSIRANVALGFLRVTMRGRGGNAEHRQPNHFLLTFAHGRDSRAQPPTHDWRKIKTIEEAEAIAKAAREAKDMSAVAFGHRSWRVRKNRNRYHKVVPKRLNLRYHKVVLQGRVTKWSHYLYLGVGAGDEAGTVPRAQPRNGHTRRLI